MKKDSILLYSFPSQHNNVKSSLAFTVYNEFIGLDGIATCFGLWSHHQAVYINIHSFIHSFINGSTALSLGHGLFFSFIIFFFFTQTVGLLGWVISPSQGLYLYTGQHKHGRNAHTNIHII
jgi:hypothetical protein